jgi:hypothetical protein
MYDARSRWAHGAHFELRPSSKRKPETDAQVPGEAPGDARIDELALFESALRSVVRRCIEEPEFATAFTNDQSVRARWPVGL